MYICVCVCVCAHLCVWLFKYSTFLNNISVGSVPFLN